jgi:predicted RNA binding protein YcfA (HicA-like mRNA interferase family)
MRKSLRREVAAGGQRAGPCEGALEVGYTVTRQTGSHIRLTTQELGEHHVTVPDHDPIRVGTLAGLLSDVAAHLGIGRDELVRKLFLD